MSTKPFSSLHPSVGADSNAHPSLVTTTIANPHIMTLLAEVNFNVEMRGLAANAHASFGHMYQPRLRKSLDTQQAVSHLDTISCWKAMSYVQAHELALWESLFHQCLVSQIEKRLRRTAIIQLSKRKDYVDEVSLLPCLMQSFPENYACFINIDVSGLLQDMIGAYCKELTSPAVMRNLQWALGSGSLHSFIYNFISIQDCFKNTPTGPCLFVKYSIDWFSFPLIAVTADIAWHPPVFYFKLAPAQIKPGAHYGIAPCRRPVRQDAGISECKSFPDHVEYVVTKSSSVAKWYHKGRFFLMQAPDRLEGNNAAVLETIMQAKVITRFPKNVLFERTSRYVIKVELAHAREVNSMTETHGVPTTLALVIPPHKSTNSLQSHGCRHVPTSPPDSLVELVDRGPDPNSECCDSKEYVEPVASGVSMQNVHDPELETGKKAPKKRTNSSREDNAIHPDDNRTHGAPDIQLKRRKLKKTDVADSQVESPPTDLSCSMLQSAQDDTPDDKFCTREMRRLSISINMAAPLIKTDSPSSQLQNESEKVIYRKPDRVRNEPYPTPPSTPSSLASSSDYGNYCSRVERPGTHTSQMAQARNGSLCLYELSQDTIQHNYHEFEAMALCQSTKQADWGDSSFEKIFMEESDAEGWHSSDVDDVDEEMDGYGMGM
ncbi:hypothetical protein COCVIDRAFT_26627 [Bipolaris victoriae FI3]|uniref:Uncharacterized protein n=1 Tax=Bipolaris victoriae (strain FI3) TaxID=930091 RepID=W7ESY0_BIPV3|nr:hypothetical protein COCVIDRAFT_26627 [Bipolaris victoriae FI3]